MEYLKSASNGKSGFSAEFTNGETTTSHDAACFFMKMDGKGADPESLRGYINLGRMMDPQHDWKEIQRIAATFVPAGEEGAR